MSNPFSIRGRMSRRQYALYTLLIVLVSYAFAFAIGFVSAVSDSAVRNAGMLGLMVGLAGCVLQALLAVQRLHDLGKPGRLVWLLLVPFYNIYFSLILCFTPGASAENEYGPVPA
jgi:uncharacterized membrane protein YhaH (DUF805 family)